MAVMEKLGLKFMLGNQSWVRLVFGLIIVVSIFFRFWQLASLPPSLYWEEVALGYDAYSILQTGKDHHGNILPLVAFESFGDWKPSLYFYSLVPSIATFGLTEFAVRLPSAISGVLIVIGVGYIVRLVMALARPKTKTETLSAYQLLGMSVTAISPWAIIFSRGAWEVNLATCLITWGVVFFLSYLHHEASHKNSSLWRLGLSVVSLALSMYAYHAARTIAPAVGLGLVLTWIAFQRVSIRHFIQLKWRQIGLCLVLAGLLLLPLVGSLGSAQSLQRFNETNIFADLTLLKKSQDLQDQTGNTLMSRVFFHRYVMYGQQILENALSHFDLNFLFISGDINARHSIQYMGQLYHIELFFLLLGLASFWQRYRKFGWLFGLWFGIGILTASITKAVPHALRILPTLPVWLLLITLGIGEAYEMLNRLVNKLPFNWLKQIAPVIIISCFAILYLIEVTLFWRFYTQIFPRQYAHEYAYGYKQMIAEVLDLQQTNPELPVFISREYGRPAMYYWFYAGTNPAEVQSQERTAVKDQSEFIEFNNISFPLKNQGLTRPSIVALTPDDYELLMNEPLTADNQAQVVIMYPSGGISWVVFVLE